MNLESLAKSGFDTAANTGALRCHTIGFTANLQIVARNHHSISMYNDGDEVSQLYTVSLSMNPCTDYVDSRKDSHLTSNGKSRWESTGTKPNSIIK